MASKFSNEIADVCIKKYRNLPRNGKPKDNEWTVLAGIVESICESSECDSEKSNLKCVSLTTGTKCLGTTNWCSGGALVHDSHAEVLAKRALQEYLADQIECAHGGKKSVFESTEEKIESCAFITPSEEVTKFSLKSSVRYHLYVSQTPCGDCSIFPKSEDALENLLTKNSLISADNTAGECLASEPPLKKARLDCESNDIHRTGAKCVDGEEEDARGVGSSFHTIGVLRRKPGRGEASLSHSCSDKILRWSVLGLRGCLLTPFISSPVYISSLVLGNSPCDIKAVKRGVYTRYENALHKMDFGTTFKLNTPKVLQSDVEFEHSRCIIEDRFSDNNLPCGASIVWYDGCTKPVVMVEGRKHGMTKKALATPKSHVSICRYQKMKRVVSLYETIKCSVDKKVVTYKDLKRRSADYLNCWGKLKYEVLPNWTVKPIHLQDFILG